VSLVAGLAAGAYSLLYKPDQFATICTFIVSVLGVYAGGSISEQYLGGRYGFTRPTSPLTQVVTKEPTSGD